MFCSATNASFAQRLNIPPEFSNRSQTVAVVKVDIEDYSRYATAAADADTGRWVDYVAAAI